MHLPPLRLSSILALLASGATLAGALPANASGPVSKTQAPAGRAAALTRRPPQATATATAPACVSTVPGWCAAKANAKGGAALWCLLDTWWCEYPDPVYGSPAFSPIEGACACAEGATSG